MVRQTFAACLPAGRPVACCGVPCCGSHGPVRCSRQAERSAGCGGASLGRPTRLVGVDRRACRHGGDHGDPAPSRCSQLRRCGGDGNGAAPRGRLAAGVAIDRGVWRTGSRSRFPGCRRLRAPCCPDRSDRTRRCGRRAMHEHRERGRNPSRAAFDLLVQVELLAGDPCRRLSPRPCDDFGSADRAQTRADVPCCTRWLLLGQLLRSGDGSRAFAHRRLQAVVARRCTRTAGAAVDPAARSGGGHRRRLPLRPIRDRGPARRRQHGQRGGGAPLRDRTAGNRGDVPRLDCKRSSLHDRLQLFRPVRPRFRTAARIARCAADTGDSPAGR